MRQTGAGTMSDPLVATMREKAGELAKEQRAFLDSITADYLDAEKRSWRNQQAFLACRWLTVGGSLAVPVLAGLTLPQARHLGSHERRSVWPSWSRSRRRLNGPSIMESDGSCISTSVIPQERKHGRTSPRLRTTRARPRTQHLDFSPSRSGSCGLSESRACQPWPQRISEPIQPHLDQVDRPHSGCH